MTDARAIIAKLRDGVVPSRDELRWFTAGLADKSVTDAQAGAFAMALGTAITVAALAAVSVFVRDTGFALSNEHQVWRQRVTRLFGFVAALALAIVARLVVVLNGQTSPEQMEQAMLQLGEVFTRFDLLEPFTRVETALEQVHAQSILGRE